MVLLLSFFNAELVSGNARVLESKSLLQFGPAIQPLVRLPRGQETP
jgi:hypothetical protein